jgi:hypothetical protein
MVATVSIFLPPAKSCARAERANAVPTTNATARKTHPFKFFAINAGYRFVSMMAMGSILTLWK